MAEINLLDKYPKSKRPIEQRGKRKLSGNGWLYKRTEPRDNAEVFLEYKLLEISRRFDKEYFDGDRLYGYGGYYYNPRFWTDTVRRFRDYYKLGINASILEVGSAKGFMLYDFKKLMPDIKVTGLDISQYAYDHAIEEIKPYLVIGNAKELPFSDKSFDLVISINTVDHLKREECKEAITEIQRVTKGNAFISVNAWRTEEEKKLQLKWNLTSLTFMSVDEWKKFFEDIGYKGDYYWFIP